MLQSALADLVVVIHLAFIVFASLGGLLALRVRWMPWLHLPAMAWGIAVEACGWICPLTPLENALRRAAGAEGYTGGFVEHYVVPVVYPADLTRSLQTGLAIGLLVLNVAIYALVWWRARGRARHDSSRPPT